MSLFLNRYYFVIVNATQLNEIDIVLMSERWIIMAVISRITTQQKNKERYNIFLQDANQEKYGFSVDEALLIEYHLYKGLDLNAELMDELMEKDIMHKAYNMVIHYLSYRMRTEKEIMDYLRKKEISEMHITTIMNKLSQKGLINDLEFAKAFVRTRINTSSKGPILIKKELLDKGVRQTIADAAINQYTYTDQYNKAHRLLQKKLNQNTKNSHQQKVQGLRTHLLQKGYTQEVVKDVVADNSSERDDAAEWEALIHHGTKQWKKLRGKYEGYQLKNKLKESLYRKGFPFPLIQTFLEEYVTDLESDESLD